MACGIPQRSILRPLFSLLHINDITRCLNKTKPWLFADDINMTALAAIIDLQTAVNFDLENLRKCFKANRLSVDMAKTEFMLIGSKSMLKHISNSHPNVFIENKPIKQVYEGKIVGGKSSIENICKKITAGISAIRPGQLFVDQDILILIYSAIVRRYFDSAVKYMEDIW